MGFLELILGFWDGFSNVVICKDINDSISSNKEQPWLDVAMKVRKTSPLDCPSQPFIGIKHLAVYVFFRAYSSHCGMRPVLYF